MPQNNLNGKNVLITGGLGFIGINLIAELKKLAAQIKIFDFGFPEALVRSYKNLGIDLIPGDICKPGSLNESVAGCDVIFHLAGHSGSAGSAAEPELDYAVNVGGMENLLSAIHKAGMRPAVVFASTRLVYGHPDVLPVTESAALRPPSPYACNKLKAEELLAEKAVADGFNYAICRISNPYGPHRTLLTHKYNIFNWFIDESLRGNALTIFGDGSQLRDYIYVGDLAQALIASALKAAQINSVLNIGSGIGVNIKSVAEEIIKITGKGSLSLVPWPEEYKKVETGDIVFDIDKAKNLLNWQPEVSLEDGIRKTVALSLDCESTLGNLLHLGE